MADPKIEDNSDEMEHDLHQLEDHIADAEKKLEARKEEADAGDDVAGGDPESESESADDAAAAPGETGSAEDVRAEVESAIDAGGSDDDADEIDVEPAKG